VLVHQKRRHLYDGLGLRHLGSRIGTRRGPGLWLSQYSRFFRLGGFSTDSPDDRSRPGIGKCHQPGPGADRRAVGDMVFPPAPGAALEPRAQGECPGRDRSLLQAWDDKKVDLVTSEVTLWEIDTGVGG
jgi:hypothetical protein